MNANRSNLLLLAALVGCTGLRQGVPDASGGGDLGGSEVADGGATDAQPEIPAALDAPDAQALPDAPTVDASIDVPQETGADAGSGDVGRVDSGSDAEVGTDSGAVDAGAADSGVVDSGVVDSGVVDSGVVDSGVVDSGAPDVPPSVVPAPRPIAPLSTATVTSRRPTLRWVLAAATDGARVEVCADRACATVERTLVASGRSAAPTADLPPGVHFWRLFGRAGSAAGAVPGPTWQFTVGANSAPVNASWGSTTDLNGDGHVDLVIGADGLDASGGRAYVYPGDGSELSALPGVRLLGGSGSNAHFGYALAGAGDLNGDGFADLVVGAYGANSSAGQVSVYRGGPTGIAATPDFVPMPPTTGANALGWSVAGLGDVNGDGYGDLALGAPGARFTAASDGLVFIYLGRATGLSVGPSTTLSAPGLTRAQFGVAVASAGDLNGDGFGDLAVGSEMADSEAGVVFVYLGSAAGIPSAPSVTLPAPDGAAGHFGAAIACAGDVDGDGYAELLVGAPQWSSRTGRAYLYRGGATGPSAAPSVTLAHAGAADDRFGLDVASVGDLNGDGLGDVAIGASGLNISTGRVSVYLGRAAGLSATPTITLGSPHGYQSRFGLSIAGVGDVNGDALDDLAVGAPAGSGPGWTDIYLGTASGLTPTPARVIACPDGSFGYFGRAVAGAGR